MSSEHSRAESSEPLTAPATKGRLPDYPMPRSARARPAPLQRAALAQLQRSAGNAAVSRMVGVSVQREDPPGGGMSTSSGTSAPGSQGPNATTMSESQTTARTAAEDALKDFSQEKFGKIGDWSGVPEDLRIKLLEKATHPDVFWVDNNDEINIARCWSSFGGSFVNQVRAHQVIWERSIDRGVDPEYVQQTAGAYATFKKDVSAGANKNLDANEDRVVKEFQQFGLEPPWDLVRPSHPDRNKLTTDRGVPKVGGPSQTDLLKDQAHFAQLLMKYDVMIKRLEGSWVGLDLPFRPGQAPPPGHSFELGDGKTMWDVTNQHWVRIATEVSLITNAYPVLYSARENGSLGTFADQKFDNPDPANPINPAQADQKNAGLEAVRTQLSGVLSAIKKTRDAEIDPLDMVPVQNALFLGRLQPESGRAPVREVMTGIMNDEKESRSFENAVSKLGVEAALITLMVLGVVGSAGGAAIAIALAAETAAKAINKADKLNTALGASVSDADAIVDRTTVTAADADAEQAKIELAQVIITSVLDLCGQAVGDHLSPEAAQEARSKLGSSEGETGGLRGRLRSAAGVASTTTEEGPMKPWGTPDHKIRASAFKDPVNVRLAHEEIPPIKDVVPNAKVKYMEFHEDDWTVHVNPKLLEGDAISQKHFDDMVEVMYHEGRHGYQEFHIARWRKAQMIAGTLPPEEFDYRVHADVYAEAKPMGPHDPMEAQARAWWESKYGSKAHKRADIYDKLSDAEADLAMKTTTLERASKSLPPDQRAALEREVAAAEAERRKWDAAYRNLPEERDAYSHQAEVGPWARKSLAVRAAQVRVDSASVRVTSLQEEVALYTEKQVSGAGMIEAQANLNQARHDLAEATDDLARANAMK